jgi:signal transduction histidine kinase
VPAGRAARRSHCADRALRSQPRPTGSRDILGNAVKFSPAGEAVRIEARQDPSGVAISIADRGPGIAPDKLPNLFERYFKGESGMGTGLGLYIAQGIVAAHGGRIWVASEPGAGCTVTFTLPVVERPREGT